MLTEQAFQVAIVVLGIAGFLLSYYIHRKKKTGIGDMSCPADGSCEAVVTSRYSKFLGVDVEVLGILYYLTIVVAYTVFALTPQAVPMWFTLGVLLSSIAAALFSAYLTFLQAFTLRMWCTWCLMSAAFCIGILSLAVPATTVSLTELMGQYSNLMFWGAIIGGSAGFGVSIGYAAILLSSLRDFELSYRESRVLKMMNHLIWTSLCVLVVSIIGLSMADPGIVLNPGFQILAFAVMFIVFNDAIYSLYTAEKLVEVDYDSGPLNLEKAVLVLAFTSLYSWTAVLTLMVFQVNLPLGTMVAIYSAGLLVAANLGIVLNSIIDRRANDNLPKWSPLH